MNLSLGKRWEEFLEQAVISGRYKSSSEVVREGLRLVEEREAKLQALRDQVEASIAAGGDNSDEDVERAIDESLSKLTFNEAEN